MILAIWLRLDRMQQQKIRVNQPCSGRTKYSGVPSALVLVQIAAILFYLNINIVNVGEMGAALSVLGFYFGASGLIFLVLWAQKSLFVRLHFLVFLLFVFWVALRVVIDFGDLERLKGVTVATTGGMLLFYLVGACFNLAYLRLLDEPGKTALSAIVLLLCFVLAAYLLIELLPRMRSDKFLIAGVDGSYQRPGDFLSIQFIILSAILVSFISARNTRGKSGLISYFWVGLYSTTTMIAIIGSQLFGSNAATAVLAGIFILTLITIILLRNKKLRKLHAAGSLALPFGRYVSLEILRNGFIALMFVILLVVWLIGANNFDIMSIRLFGFGAGTNSSLTSRFDIFAQFGASQISYAPFLGNMNVAYLITGDAGRTLHSFFPYVQANLGLVGLIISVTFFAMVICQLYRSVKIDSVEGGSLNNAIVMLYFIFILLFLLLLANLAVTVTWAVIWFAVGFISQPFGFKSSLKI